MSYTPPPPPPPAPALAPNGMPLAGFGDRLLAYLIDWAIFIGISVVLAVPTFIALFFLVIGEIDSAQRTGRDPNPLVIFGLYFAAYGVVFLFLMVASYIYYVEIQLRRRGQTVGKNVMKLWVIPVQPGAGLTRNHLLKRWAVQHVGGAIVPMFTYLDGLWQLWDKPLQQCLHDKAAETVVVKLG